MTSVSPLEQVELFLSDPIPVQKDVPPLKKANSRRKKITLSTRSALTTSTNSNVSLSSRNSFDAVEGGHGFKFLIKSIDCENLNSRMDLGELVSVRHIADGSNSHIFQGAFGPKLLPVIIKTIGKTPRNAENAVREFALEKDVLMRFSHPNIVKYVGSGKDFGNPFIVLEFLSGGSLGKILKDHSQSDSPPFSYRRVLEIGLALARALQYIHYKFHDEATIIHRDLKPDNIAFTDQGVLKLIDFGLCTVVKRRGNSQESYQMTGKTGSARYMAPEVHMWQPYSEMVDVYSYGLVMWQVATGLVPFGALTTSDCKRRIVLNRERPPLLDISLGEKEIVLPEALCDLLSRSWHWRPELRPSSSDLVEQFSLLLNGQIGARSACTPLSWFRRKSRANGGH